MSSGEEVVVVMRIGKREPSIVSYASRARFFAVAATTGGGWRGTTSGYPSPLCKILCLLSIVVRQQV